MSPKKVSRSTSDEIIIIELNSVDKALDLICLLVINHLDK